MSRKQELFNSMARTISEQTDTIERVRDVVTRLESSASEAFWYAAQMVKRALDSNTDE